MVSHSIEEKIIKGFVIGATGSGTGKTTLTLALLAYLADAGYKVVLVDKEPSIGGIMARLDKTFPTMDCSI